MSMKYMALAVGLVLAAPNYVYAQGTVRGAEEGADQGAAAAGPVGGVVGGAVGAATGTVNGVVGAPVDRDRGCDSKTVTREDGAGNSDTVKRTDCN